MILKKIFFRLFSAMLTLVFLLSCQGENDAGQKLSTKMKDEVVEMDLAIVSFSYIPPQIKGCSCFLSSSKEEFKKKNYIYINDFIVTSYVNINGVLTKFIMLNFDYVNSNKSVATYKSSGYELKIEMQHLEKDKNNIGVKTGKITVTSKDGRSTSKTFYGKCGC